MKNFYERLKAICDQNNVTIYALEKAIGSSKGSFVKWKVSSPSAVTLVKIADYFCISVDDLLGHEVRKKPHVSK